MFLVANYTLNSLAFPYWRQIILNPFHFSYAGGRAVLAGDAARILVP